MINLDFSEAVSLYIVIILTSIFITWVFRKRQKEKDLLLEPRYIWFCSICTHTYINTKEEKISTCPRCGSYNKK